MKEGKASQRDRGPDHGRCGWHLSCLGARGAPALMARKGEEEDRSKAQYAIDAGAPAA
jgi:hypothetical protein